MPKAKSRSRSKMGKGRGRKGKRKTLTDEEKKKKEELKALAEREKLARRRELTKAFLTLKKDKEYELIKLNEKKLLDNWRPLLRRQKIKELMDDYKMMQHAFERAYNRKNNVINMFENTIEKAETDYDHGVDTHMYNLDKMMEFYRKRIDEIRELFTKNRNMVLERLNEEKNRIRDNHISSVQAILDNMEATKKRLNDSEAQARIELLMKEEDLRNHELQDMHTFRTEMEARMEKQWDAIQGRVNNFEAVTRDKRKEFLRLKDRDLKVSAEIDAQFTKYALLTGGIAKINRRSELFQKAFASYIDELKDKKLEERAIYNQLMIRRKILLTHCQDRTAVLALTTREVIEAMDKMLDIRAKVLKAAERARRCEQLQEKVDPFLKRFDMVSFVGEEEDPAQTDANANSYLYKVHGAVHNLDCDCEKCTCMDEISGEGAPNIISAPINAMMNDYSFLERFWMRFNKVTLDKGVLQARRDELAIDNMNLKIGLRNYMGGMNPAALDAEKFAEQMKEENCKEVIRITKIMTTEKKRRERSRKVGGIRMF